MIKIYFNKLKNGNLEITENTLNDILSYIKGQEKALDNFRPFTFSYQIKQENKVLKERIAEAIEYINTWGYDEYELFRIDVNNPNFTTNEDVPTIVKTLRNILKGENNEK